MKNIPNCANTFKSFYISNDLFYQAYRLLGSPKPFDVTLRDGLQSLNFEETFDLEKKIKIYDYIIENYMPTNIEVGSVVSNKILPIFKDTEQIFNYAESYRNINNYVLVPNADKLTESMIFGVKNFSFITSVSNSFQIKNTKMNLDESYNSIKNMMDFLNEYKKQFSNIQNRYIYKDNSEYKVKIYVSCINECPIEGKISTSIIVDKLYRLSQLKPNKICLSDTCGTLTIEDFREIIYGVKNRGLTCSLFSLHLHINSEREKHAEEIVHYALNNQITEFDVSLIKYGGCSVTMDKKRLLSNMTYEQYYRFIANYIINKCK